MASEHKTFKQIFMMVTINELQNEPFMFSLSELLFAGLQNSPNIYQLLPEFAVLMTLDHSESCFSTGISMQMKILRMIREWQRVENKTQTKLFTSANINDYLDQPSVLLRPVQISNQMSVAKAAVILMSFDHFVTAEENAVDNVDDVMNYFPNYPSDLVICALQTKTFSRCLDSQTTELLTKIIARAPYSLDAFYAVLFLNIQIDCNCGCLQDIYFKTKIEDVHNKQYISGALFLVLAIASRLGVDLGPKFAYVSTARGSPRIADNCLNDFIKNFMHTMLQLAAQLLQKEKIISVNDATVRQSSVNHIFNIVLPNAPQAVPSLAEAPEDVQNYVEVGSHLLLQVITKCLQSVSNLSLDV